MKNKIFTVIGAYINLLNMNPGAVSLLRKKFSPESGRESRLWVNILLFIITIITTTFAGASEGETIIEIAISGLPFSITIMTILLSHEMGHYLAARHFGVKATLPYFIPFPSIIGTMGAVIKIKSPIKDRRALLYIGALGPIVGFVLSLAVSIYGIYTSEIVRLPENMDGSVMIFGDSILFAAITRIVHGAIPQGHDIIFNHYSWAGWIGFLVTSLNLMPMGQLDGSHIMYALLGRKQLYFGWAAFTALLVLSFIWPGWIIWVILTLVFLMVGHPPVDDVNELSAWEKLTGWSCAVIFIISFIPVPVILI